MPTDPPNPPRITFLRELLPDDMSAAEIAEEERRFWCYLRLYHKAARRALEREQDSTLRQSDSMMGGPN